MKSIPDDNISWGLSKVVPSRISNILASRPFKWQNPTKNRNPVNNSSRGPLRLHPGDNSASTRCPNFRIKWQIWSVRKAWCLISRPPVVSGRCKSWPWSHFHSCGETKWTLSTLIERSGERDVRDKVLWNIAIPMVRVLLDGKSLNFRAPMGGFSLRGLQSLEADAGI